MTYRTLSTTQAIPKVFLRQPSNETDVQTFRTAMLEMLSRIQPDESEELNKNLVADFFNKSLYLDHTYMVNTYQRKDPFS